MSVYKTAWKSPSNIALVKYWGKKDTAIGNQLPANASFSFTLNNCATSTHLHFEESDHLEISIKLAGKNQPDFIPKIKQFIERIAYIFPFATKGKYSIETSNSFPHSSGIASSASGMSALALCICDIAEKKNLLNSDNFFQTASELARLGSGSASRSLYGPMAVWGTHPNFENSSDNYAIAYTNINSVFADYCDSILLVHRGQKTVSSTVGHNLINDHPFAQNRFNQAQDNMSSLKSILDTGNLDDFIALVESEALTLHSLMMSSNPYFILMKPNTLSIIERIWKQREEQGVKWCFTLDAGANVHFLYPNTDKEKAQKFIQDDLLQFCEDEGVIHDCVGQGPKKLV